VSDGPATGRPGEVSKGEIAVVGTGVAGLGCAWNLRDVASLSLFEKQERPGGHTNTVMIEEDGSPVPIDTGFIVFNKVTYPNLLGLFERLGVAVKASEMSFSVQHLPRNIEFNGMGPNKLFAQRSNLLNPRFYGLLRQIFRFFRIARASLDNPDDLPLREFVAKHRLGDDFLDLYLVPMSSAVWSTDPDDVLDFPASTLIRFFHNHGFLGVTTHHPWFTVGGGARTYVDKILGAVGQPVLSAPVRGVTENDTHAVVTFADGSRRAFDRVVLACHADEALAVLDAPTPDQRRLLGAFRYQTNAATLHTWPGVMPRRRLAWASWNYRIETRDGHTRATTHYWMNALQGVSGKRDYFVSLNSQDAIPASHVLYQTTYEHPVFNREAVNAQSQLDTLNTQSPSQRVFFCGSYFKYGFHEDAYTSGLNLARTLRGCITAGS
jgi:uncharacterized protein